MQHLHRRAAQALGRVRPQQVVQAEAALGVLDDQVRVGEFGQQPARRTGAGWMNAGHKVVYENGQGIEHSSIYKKAAKAPVYRLRYWNFHQGRWESQATGASPVIVARNANYFWRKW